MKRALLLLTLVGSVIVAQDFTTVINSNQELTKVNDQLENKISELKKELKEYKKNLLIKLNNEIEDEQNDYEITLKDINLFKLKHGNNIYAQEQIKENEKKLKIIRDKHLEFKRKHTVQVEQLKHDGFVPAEKRDIQDKIFYFEIKKEEFREVYEINKKRYEEKIKLAIERYTKDSDALVEEFKNLQYKKLK